MLGHYFRLPLGYVRNDKTMKNFAIRFRLRSTSNSIHPIEAIVGLGIKDSQGRYVYVYKSIGMSISDKEWDKNRNFPTDSKLAIKLYQLEDAIQSRLTIYKEINNEHRKEAYETGVITKDIEEEIDWVIHARAPKRNEEINKEHYETLPEGFAIKRAIKKIRDADFKLVDKNNNEIDLKKFLSLLNYPTEQYFVDEIGANARAQRIDETSKHIENKSPDDTSELFSDYILKVAAKKMALPGKGKLKDPTHYENLSKKFAEWNNTITLNQYNDDVAVLFLNWLKTELKSLNNFAKYVAKLKSVVYWAIDEDRVISPLKVRPSSKVYSSEKEEVHHPYLTEEQLSSLARLEFTPEQKELEYVRDLFIIGSYCGGFRFGDWRQAFHVQQQKREDGHVVNFIESMSQKVGERKQIPIHDIAYELLKKYDFKFQEIDDDEFNLKIKDVCAMASIFDDSFNKEFISYKKDLITGEPQIVKIHRRGWPEARVPKFHEMIASHTARRSFATNMYYHRKIQPEIVMQMTGHAKLDDFMLYVQASSRTKFDDFVNQVVLPDRQKSPKNS